MASLDFLKNLLGNQDDPTAMPTLGQPEPDPQIARDYVMKKYGMDQRNALQDQISQENTGPQYAAGLAALGAGLQGGNAAAAGQNFLEGRRKDQEKRVGDFDKNALFAEESDPNSQASQFARSLAVKMGADPEKIKPLTAYQLKQYSPTMGKMYEIDQNALARRDANETKENIAALSKEARDRADADKREEKDFALATPFGKANTPDDAKQLKEAAESKKDFDSKISELIQLRKEKGGEAWDKVAIDRGKQLSKDLLLQYKNLAKLGVLSKSDESIINAIIPEDPLEFRSVRETIQGTDSTLNRLEKFKQDSDADFQNRLATRIRGGDTSKFAGSPAPTDTKQAAGDLLPSSAVKPGDIVKGKRFKGGDPSNRNSWEAADMLGQH